VSEDRDFSDPEKQNMWVEVELSIGKEKGQPVEGTKEPGDNKPGPRRAPWGASEE
jgi:hypothetical protein